MKLEFDAETCRQIVYEDHEDFEVVSDEITDNSRWSIIHMVIVMQVSTGKFFRSFYSVGATEQ